MLKTDTRRLRVARESKGEIPVVTVGVDCWYALGLEGYPPAQVHIKGNKTKVMAIVCVNCAANDVSMTSALGQMLGIVVGDTVTIVPTD